MQISFAILYGYYNNFNINKSEENKRIKSMPHVHFRITPEGLTKEKSQTH